MADKRKGLRKSAPGRDLVPNVFIAWGGERSRQLAKALYDWLPNVNSDIRPWMSEESLRSGATWFAEIMKALTTVEAGIICLTPENLRNHWMHFEAGAIANRVSESTRVMTCLLDLKHREVVQPLSQFHARRAAKDGEMLKLVQDLTDATGDTVGEATLKNRFTKFWGDLNAKVEAATAASDEESSEGDTTRDVDDMFGEILELVRSLDAGVARSIELSERAITQSQGPGIMNRLFAPVAHDDATPISGPTGPTGPKFADLKAALELDRVSQLLQQRPIKPADWSDADLLLLLTYHEQLPPSTRRVAEKVLHASGRF